MKKKNIIIVVICLLIIAVAIFLGYKAYNFKKYSFDNEKYKFINTYIDKIEFKDTITLKKNPVVDSDYVTYKNFGIVDKFTNFTESECAYNCDAYILSENGRNTAKFSIGILDYTIGKMLIADSAYGISGSGDNIIKEDEVNIEKFYKDNNIKTEMDVINYAIEHKNDKLNIFTNSVEDRKIRTLFYAYMGFYFETYDEVYLIDGDYEGILGVTDIEANGMHIIEIQLFDKMEKTYTLSFMSQDYFDLDFVKSLLDTIVIE